MPNWENRSFEVEKNQVFPTADWVPVVTAMQKAQQAGNGIFASFNLTTVENSWWGVPAGLTFDVTFGYLGRLSQWEDKLSRGMQELVVPDTTDLSVDINHGPFRSFPHYATKGGGVNAEQANLLADLTGWSVLQHEDLFRRVLS
jgi:hypothetical protein